MSSLAEVEQPRPATEASNFLALFRARPPLDSLQLGGRLSEESPCCRFSRRCAGCGASSQPLNTVDRPKHFVSLTSLSGAAVLLLGAANVWGQSALQGTTLTTGGGFSLHSVTVDVPGRPSVLTNMLQMIVGLSTDERRQPQVIPDAVTVNVVDLTGQKIAVVVTADITGFVWRPETPWAIPLSASSVSASLVAFPSLDPVRETANAYMVLFQLPATFYGEEIKIVMDLFDNQNALGSTAFLGNVALVPEPSAALLLGLGGLAGLIPLFRRRS